MFASCTVSLSTLCSAAIGQPLIIKVVDEASGRGVPLVRLTTTNGIVHYTDSAGVVAFDEPGLMGGTVWFGIESPGYSLAADGFGMVGRAVDAEPGATVTIEIERMQIAERMYQITGQGIYHQSERAGLPAPLARPNLNGRVMGQDSVMALQHDGRLYWFWGDTARPEYPLGHFGTACATSPLPGEPGCDPDVGIDLTYVVNDADFSRPVFDLGRPGMVWLGGVTELTDPDGAMCIVGHYARMKDLGTMLEHGVAAFDDERAMMAPVAVFPDDAVHAGGHTVRAVEDDKAYIYFAATYPLLRVRATWEHFIDPEAYEAWTPLVAGMRALDPDDPAIERDEDGKPVYGWKRSTAVVSAGEHRALIEAGHLAREESWINTVDVADGEPIMLHGGSIRYNDCRGRWVMIATRAFAPESFLGEIYYSEAPSVHGPWDRAVKVATHPGYSFYNPVHHDFFDGAGGRLIYFEGTYTRMFSQTEVATPRYDYNQIMYRIDLADERIAKAFAER